MERNKNYKEGMKLSQSFTRYSLGQASVCGRLDRAYTQSLLKGLC